MVGPDEVLNYWLDECGPEGWYAQDDARDADIRKRFEKAWEGARDGRYSMWLTYPSGALAYIVLTDQFSRNMFREDARSFALDRVAQAAAKSAIDRGWDMRIDEPARQFFYIPLTHSENLCDQDRAVRLIFERMPDTGAVNLMHARAHREVIREYGRFPHRNDVLGRAMRPAEAEYLAAGGYGSTLRALQNDKAA